jgi:glycosyltransferase involved in cell wall biosynthesis
LKTWQKAALGAAGGFAGATALLWGYVNSKANDETAQPVALAASVSVIMPTYNEEGHVEVALKSLREQNVVKANPDRFEFIVVDSHSRDRTVELARPYVDRVITAPIGLLTARTMAIQQSTGDIIVSVNADTVYPPNWLNLMLGHFSDPEVVGVMGLRVYEGVLGPLTMWHHLFHPRFFGSHSAFLRWAFYAAGGFNLKVNQSRSEELVWAEEVDFLDRLEQVGKVVFEWSAVAPTSARRAVTRLELDHTSFR